MDYLNPWGEGKNNRNETSKWWFEDIEPKQCRFAVEMVQKRKKKGIYQKSSKSSKSKKNCEVCRGTWSKDAASGVTWWDLSGLSRDYPAIIQGHAVQSLMHLASYPQALCFLPFWRENMWFFNPTSVDYWVTLTSCSGLNQQSLEKCKIKIANTFL